MNYRIADSKDIMILAEIRKKQLIDEGIEPGINIDRELIRYFTEKMADHTLIEWVAEEAGVIIATAAIIFFDFPPCFTNKTGKQGYIANVYTAPDFRRKGIATEMLDRLVAEARAREVKHLWLEASKLGRPVYEKYGFNAMEKWLELQL